MKSDSVLPASLASAARSSAVSSGTLVCLGTVRLPKGERVVIQHPKEDGGKMAWSCRHPEYSGTKFVAWNANSTLDFRGALRSNSPVAVLKASSGRLSDAQQFGHLGAGKRSLLAVFPQKEVRFRHIDTYGIDPNTEESIPNVSDCSTGAVYHSRMTQSVYNWQQWGERLKFHLKENGQNLAKLAEKMVDADGKPMAESTLRSWTNGNRNINLADFVELCRLAKADPVLILFGRPLMSEDVQKQIGALAYSVMEPEQVTNMAFDKLMGGIQTGSGKKKSRLKRQTTEGKEPATEGSRRKRT